MPPLCVKKKIDIGQQKSNTVELSVLICFVQIWGAKSFRRRKDGEQDLVDFLFGRSGQICLHGSEGD